MRMSIMENAGFNSEDMSVENIAANIDTIIDMTSAVQFGAGANPFMPQKIAL